MNLVPPQISKMLIRMAVALPSCSVRPPPSPAKIAVRLRALRREMRIEILCHAAILTGAVVAATAAGIQVRGTHRKSAEELRVKPPSVSLSVSISCTPFHRSVVHTRCGSCVRACHLSRRTWGLTRGLAFAGSTRRRITTSGSSSIFTSCVQRARGAREGGAVAGGRLKEVGTGLAGWVPGSGLV